jgi:hypothetical protein
MIPFWLPFELSPLLGTASVIATTVMWFVAGGVRP